MVNICLMLEEGMKEVPTCRLLCLMLSHATLGKRENPERLKSGDAEDRRQGSALRLKIVAKDDSLPSQCVLFIQSQ